jgi:hypothetical protein
MPVKKLFHVGQSEIIVFIYVSYLTRESTLYFLNVNKYWHDRKRWEKEANIVKVAFEFLWSYYPKRYNIIYILKCNNLALKCPDYQVFNQ